VQVRIAAPTPVTVAQHLAGWGALVEVLAPESVRAELARLGAELVRRYAPEREPTARETTEETAAMPSAPPAAPLTDELHAPAVRS
jgi:hypothetical protein